MFASSSRTVLARAVRTGASSFSTSAPRLKSAQPMIVELTQDVPGLGRAYDRVSVKRGRVLSELLPQRMIRLLPWKKAGHRPGVSIRGPDRAAATTNPLLAAPAAPSPQLERVIAKVRAVPSTLTFSRRTISPDEPAMHGSLTIADVRDLLASQYQLTASEVEFAWSGNDPKQRIKELGSYGGKISVRGGAAKDAVEIVVEIVREA